MASGNHSHTHWNTTCVLGSGNALNKDNVPIALRMSCAINFADSPSDIAFFGCHMPSMTDTSFTEAQTMELDWTNRLERMAFENSQVTDPEVMTTGNERLKNLMSLKLIRHETKDINNISSTCKEIVAEYLASGDTVDIIINNRHQKRTRDLLKHHIRLAGLPVEETLAKANFVPCADIQSKGLPYIKAVLRETAAKLKAWHEITFS